MYKLRARKPAIFHNFKARVGHFERYKMAYQDLPQDIVEQHARILFFNWMITLTDTQLAYYQSRILENSTIGLSKIKVLSGEAPAVCDRFLEMLKQLVYYSSHLAPKGRSGGRSGARVSRRRQNRLASTLESQELH